MQEGVANPGDLKVAQRAAGANMSVDIAVGDFWIRTETDTPDGLVHGYSDAISNQAVTASHATLPRVDSVYIQYNDSALGAGVGGDTPTPRVLAGTATTGATIDNRSGAPAPPNDALLVADLFIPAASVSVTTTNIRDRRAWARGINYWVKGNAAGNFSTTSTTTVQLAAGVFDARHECSGTTLDFDFNALVQHSVINGQVVLSLLMDGALIYRAQQMIPSAGGLSMLTGQHSAQPTAGSHLFTWQWFTDVAGTATMFNSGSLTPTMRMREHLRAVANNT